MQLGCTAATANPSSDPADPNRCLFHGTTKPRLHPRHRESLRTGPTERCAVGPTRTNADCSKLAAPSRGDDRLSERSHEPPAGSVVGSVPRIRDLPLRLAPGRVDLHLARPEYGRFRHCTTACKLVQAAISCTGRGTPPKPRHRHRHCARSAIARSVRVLSHEWA